MLLLLLEWAGQLGTTFCVTFVVFGMLLLWKAYTPTYHKLLVLKKLGRVPRHHNQLKITFPFIIHSWHTSLRTQSLQPIAFELDTSSVPLALPKSATPESLLGLSPSQLEFERRLDLVNRLTIETFDQTSLTFPGELHAIGRYVTRITAKRKLTNLEQQAFDHVFQHVSQAYEVVMLLDHTVPMEKALHYYRMRIEKKPLRSQLSAPDYRHYKTLEDKEVMRGVRLSLAALHEAYERSLYTAASRQPLCWRDFLPTKEDVIQHKRWERLPVTTRETPRPSKRLN